MLEIRDNNDFIVTGDDGLEELLKILFYYHNDERGKDYYFLYRPENEEDVFVLCSSDGNSLEVSIYAYTKCANKNRLAEC